MSEKPWATGRQRRAGARRRSDGGPDCPLPGRTRLESRAVVSETGFRGTSGFQMPAALLFYFLYAPNTALDGGAGGTGENVQLVHPRWPISSSRDALPLCAPSPAARPTSHRRSFKPLEYDRMLLVPGGLGPFVWASTSRFPRGGIPL